MSNGLLYSCNFLGSFVACCCVLGCSQEASSNGIINTQNRISYSNEVNCTPSIKEAVRLPMSWGHYDIKIPDFKSNVTKIEKRPFSKTQPVALHLSSCNDLAGIEYTLLTDIEKKDDQTRKAILKSDFSYLNIWDFLTLAQILEWAPECQQTKLCDITAILDERTDLGNFQTPKPEWRNWTRPSTKYKTSHPGNIGLSLHETDGGVIPFLYYRSGSDFYFVAKTKEGLNIRIKLPTRNQENSVLLEAGLDAAVHDLFSNLKQIRTLK